MSDGQFSSKPIRSGNNRESPWQADAYSADAMPSAAGQDMLASVGVQHEVNALLEQLPHRVGDFPCAPFPRNTPTGAMELGRPIASAILVQEYLIGLLFLRFWGWVFLFCGGLFILGACVTLGAAGARQDNPLVPAAVLVGMGLAVGGAGAWFGILRGRVINERCWLCASGMVWLTEGRFDWYPWEEVPEVYCNLSAERPAVGIRFTGDICWISFSNTHGSRFMVDGVENRASATLIQRTLRMIADGKAVRFGTWRLRRSSIQNGPDEFAWQDIADMEHYDRELVLHHRRRDDITIPLDEIPYPSMFKALARALLAFSRERRA